MAAGTSYLDTGRFGVVREGDGSFTVVDKQMASGPDRYVLTTRSQNKAHSEAARLNEQHKKHSDSNA